MPRPGRESLAALQEGQALELVAPPLQVGRVGQAVDDVPHLIALEGCGRWGSVQWDESVRARRGWGQGGRGPV